MLQPTPGIATLRYFWGTIQSAVSERVTTQELWRRVREAADAQGLDLRGVNAIDMGRLRSIAAQQRRAEQAFAAARPDATLTSEHFAPDISSRSLEARTAAPQTLVRFEALANVGQQVQSFWRSALFMGAAPETKAELQSLLDRDAARMAEESGEGGSPIEGDYVGVGRVVVLQV